ncbi:hypothetical protein B296_00012405 [Ensete ventricosum]|uniref:Uncharacterized protein n=1 Tax=Ensete ventricosum TaxID=4639 RepID=A0A426ZNU5_ENSVE|nr:hypothetical protein B296_00012405 [Ensete ventricosum]
MVFPTLRVEHYERGTSDAQLRENLDFLEENVSRHIFVNSHTRRSLRDSTTTKYALGK